MEKKGRISNRKNNEGKLCSWESCVPRLTGKLKTVAGKEEETV